MPDLDGTDPTTTSAATDAPRATAGSTERRIVSVLFADLVGFTALSDDRDPEAVREFLDGYFSLARERIARYGGTIEKFIGDAVMAVWGTPVAHEDDAERAVRAALDLVDAIGALRAPDGSSVMVRAGVLTGEAAVSLGADGQGMVAGDLVNTASRLQSAAPPGAVLVGEATMRATEQTVVYEVAGDQVIRGKESPVPAWLAMRVVAGRGGARRSARLEAPFVGRDDELRLLKELLHATARERRARLVSILGIAGIGKSRLTWELDKYIDGLAEPIYWHQGRSPAYGEGLAFWALGEMVRGRAGIAETDPPEFARGKLAAMAAEYIPDDDERSRVEPRLAALLGLSTGTAGSVEELTAAWRTLFERIADRGPTVLVFEDLHWADPGLLDFIEGLLTASRTRPILVLALARPELVEERPTFGASLRNHIRLDLAPLADDAMDLLLLGLVPGIPQAALRMIRERAAGIPLYAVETVRMLMDQGRLRESDGRFHLAGDLGTLAVPESLQGLLGARLDALDDPSRELVGRASVLGISFTVDALVALEDRPGGELRRHLDELVGREILLLDDDPSSPERGQYRFIQGVLREVAYGRLSRRERQARHLAAARYFETMGSEELTGVVAVHYLDALRSAPDEADRSELTLLAVAALESAANRSAAIGAHASAAGYLGDALSLTTDESAAIRFREARAQALGAAGRIEESIAAARDLVDEAAARTDRGLQARAALILAGGLLVAGRPADARDVAERVRAEIGSFADTDPDGVRLTAEVVRTRLMSGDAIAARELLEATLPLAERLGLRPVIAELLASKGWTLASEGRILEAIALLRGALVFAEREGLFNAEMRTRMNLSAWAIAESPVESFEVSLRATELALEHGNRGWAMSAAGNAADSAVALGEWDRVEEIASRLDVLGGWTSPWDFSVPVVVCTVRGYRGRGAEARALLDRYELQFGDRPDPQMTASTVALRAHLAFADGDLEEAIRRGRELDALVLGSVVPSDSQVSGAVAMEARDRVRLAEVIAFLGLGSEGGRLSRVLRDALIGAGRFFDGDLEGLLEMDRAADIFRIEGLRYDLAWLRRARAMLAPDDQGAPAAAAEARAILSDLGALTLLRGLPADPELGAEPGDRGRVVDLA
jgi:class 3 adenylate cyclase/tetratricopeptide (TPR) repeat protein